jgi:hypothetical protein
MISCVLIEDLVRDVEIYGTFACLGHSLVWDIRLSGTFAYQSRYPFLFASLFTSLAS